MNHNSQQAMTEELQQEAERIFNILMQLHTQKIQVNTSINKLIQQNIKKKYLKNDTLIEHYVIKMIPWGLLVSKSGKYVFDQEFY